jgi:cytochrome c-type biogenesis protein CcsB
MRQQTLARSGFCGLILLLASVAALGSDLNFDAWGRLAIQDNGRRKPISSFAHESLMRISGRPTVTTLTNGTRGWSASEWVLSMLLGTYAWEKEPMILVSSRPLVQELGLDPDKKRFSYAELSSLDKLKALAMEGHNLQTGEQTLDRTHQEALDVTERLILFGRIMEGSAFFIVPPQGTVTDPWLTPPDYARFYTDQQFAPARDALRAMATAYAQGDAFNFSLNATKLQINLRQLSPAIYPSAFGLELECFYNNLGAFSWALLFYALALGFLIAGQTWPSARFLLHGVWVFVAPGLVMHAFGIGLRCAIAGRPPVTNMYESIVWVSFAVSFFASLFYARYRAVFYLAGSLPVSILLLLLVQQLPVVMPDRLDPLVPVLRNNYWLTIHVLTITASYAAFALAMGLGHIVLWKYIVSPRRVATDENIHFWLYRTLQLGVLLLAIGTILGGVWANYSWGRFWGWDPKETWALTALLCYIFALHGRLAGLWADFGLAVASVVCFLSVVMAWYGVNFLLGKGLHSYGFGIGGESYVFTAVALDGLYVATAAWRRLTAWRKMSRRTATPLDAPGLSEQA